MLVLLSENCEIDDISNYSNQALTLADKLLQADVTEKVKKYIQTEKGNAYNNLGFMCESQGNPSKAKENYEKSLEAREKAGDQLGMAVSLTTIGAVFKNKGEINTALNYFDKSYKIAEKLNNKNLMALNLDHIGGVYVQQGDATQAWETFKRAVKLNTEANNKSGLAISLNNLGTICVNKKDLTHAIDYYNQSLKIYEELGHTPGINRILFNIGRVYFDKGNLETSMQYCKRCINLSKQLGEKPTLCGIYQQISRTYIKFAETTKNSASQQKNYTLALRYNDSATFISNELGYPESIRNSEEVYSIIYSQTGKYEQAFEHYKKYIAFRDSTINTETRKASVRSQLKNEFEKKEAVIKEQQEKERAVAREKDRFQKIVISSVIIGLLFVAVFAAFIFRNLRVTRLQKTIIEEKQKEIVDSIQYAKRIQNALMPTENYIDSNIKRLKKNRS